MLFWIKASYESSVFSFKLEDQIYYLLHQLWIHLFDVDIDIGVRELFKNFFQQWHLAIFVTSLHIVFTWKMHSYLLQGFGDVAD